MKIRSITFKPPEPKLKIIKSVIVYISEKHSRIIIAPMSKEPKAGYSYEQNECEVLDLDSPLDVIGKSIQENFKKYNIKEKKDGMNKIYHWSAFKLSKEKSVRKFKENYSKFYISGITDRNNTLRIESFKDLPIKIEITSLISAHCEPSDLGNRILKMFWCDIVDRRREREREKKKKNIKG